MSGMMCIENAVFLYMSPHFEQFDLARFQSAAVLKRPAIDR